MVRSGRNFRPLYCFCLGSIAPIDFCNVVANQSYFHGFFSVKIGRFLTKCGEFRYEVPVCIKSF